MKQTQIFGLKEEAKKFLEENVEMIPNAVCPDCGKVVTQTINSRIYENAKDAGLQCDGPKLKEYILKDGRVVREVISKCRPYINGTLHLFLNLVDENTTLYEWSDTEIDSTSSLST